jgi:predicted peptidase
LGLTGCFGTGSGFVKSANGKGAPPGRGFQTRTVVVNGETKYYSVFIPWGYDARQKYPTIVFLHGVGEGGNNGTKNLTVGLAPAIRARQATFPFIAVFPQTGGNWKEKEHADIAVAVLNDASRQFSVDQDRVILTGLSTGGYGTWYIGALHRDRFAALVPMCAYSAYDHVPQLTRIPIWAFHNNADPFVSSGGTKQMVERINRAGGNAKQTIFGSFGHNCWVEAYDDPKLYEWMLAQRRGNFAPAGGGGVAK